MPRTALLLVVVLALTAIFTAATYDMHGRPSIGIEDANIFFVYASNIAAGHGFVYNVGGGRVEGATSLLWVLLALTVFRYTYFGFPLPNTYYARVSPSIVYNLAPGVSYLGEFVRFGPVVAVAVLLVPLSLAYRVARLLTPPFERESLLGHTADLFGRTSLLVVLCAGLLAIPVINGGDHFPWFRFYQPGYPILLLFLIYLTSDMLVITGIRLTTPQRYLTGAVVVIFALMYSQGDTNWRGLRTDPPFGLELGYARGGWTAGERFAEVFSTRERYPSIGVLSAGGVKRTYPGEVMDLMGLNHVKMGHSPGSREGIKNHAAFNRDVF